MIRWHVYCRFFNDAATTDIYAYGHTLSRHDALPISAEIDRRYLGSRRVLVRVDGVRYVLGASASGVPGSTDLNSIPESAIERIEVLQDGASAIYGSDAIAGVVNIITKKRQEGLEASAQIGVFEQGDGTTQNYQIGRAHV